MKFSLPTLLYLATTSLTTASKCPFMDLGTPTPGHREAINPADREHYNLYLKGLDVGKLYHTVERVMLRSQECWPADGPQDGDIPNYAGFFGRLAWHW